VFNINYLDQKRTEEYNRVGLRVTCTEVILSVTDLILNRLALTFSRICILHVSAYLRESDSAFKKLHRRDQKSHLHRSRYCLGKCEIQFQDFLNASHLQHYQLLFP